MGNMEELFQFYISLKPEWFFNDPNDLKECPALSKAKEQTWEGWVSTWKKCDWNTPQYYHDYKISAQYKLPESLSITTNLMAEVEDPQVEKSSSSNSFTIPAVILLVLSVGYLMTRRNKAK